MWNCTGNARWGSMKRRKMVWKVTVRRCGCGRRVKRGRFRCRRCARDDGAWWAERHPETMARRERRRLMAYWRMLGVLPAGVCACGKPGRVKLIDIYDPSTVWHQCESCERRMWWARRRGVAFEPVVVRVRAVSRSELARRERMRVEGPKRLAAMRARRAALKAGEGG